MLAQHAAQTFAGHHAHLGTDKLDGCHQRKGNQGHPQRGIPQGCPRHGIRADPRRIVIRGPGDQTWP